MMVWAFVLCVCHTLTLLTLRAGAEILQHNCPWLSHICVRLRKLNSALLVLVTVNKDARSETDCEQGRMQ